MRPLFILAAILIFSVLIAVHELGHFLMAKLCGVRVNEFSIGMGPSLWQRTVGQTQYSLRAFPIGGYCAMEGEDTDTGEPDSFVRQGFWKKFLILIAGSLMNFLTGLVILLVLYSGASALLFDQVVKLAPEYDTAAPNALWEGDLIYKVNGYRTYSSGDTKLFLSYADGPVDFVVLREGQRVRLEGVEKKTYTDASGQSYQGFGIYIGVAVEEATFSGRIRQAWYSTLDFVQLVWFSLGQLFSGKAGMEDISGPVGIVSTMTEVGTQAQSTGDAWSQIFYFAALLAVNLSVMNLLPIPALDGGRVFFLMVDAIAVRLFHRAVPEKYQAAVNLAGFTVLMGFMLFVTFFDIFRLIR